MHASNLAVRRLESVRPALESGMALGCVTSVNGSRATVAAETAPWLGQRENPLSIGKLIAIDTGRSRVVGMIYAAEAADHGRSGTTLVRLELVGEIRDTPHGLSFDRGIRDYPAVGSISYAAHSSDLEVIYDYGGEETIVVGRLSQAARIAATVRVQDLLEKHFAVLGTTGCGKSSALALILREILKANDAARVLLIDPHNEYSGAFADRAEVVSPRNLHLPFWLFSFEELVDVIYKRRPGVIEEIDLLADLIPLAKARFSQKQERGGSLVRRDADDQGFTVDSPVPFRMSDIVAMIDEQIGKLDGKEDRPKLRRLKARIQSVALDPRYQFMFSTRTVEDTMAEILKMLFRIPMNGKPLTILELAGFPAEVVDAVVSVLCRLAFDLGVWGNGRVPLLVVCEEAHRYVPADKRLGFGPTRRAVSRIAKEGRKYGIYLSLVTQRPAELDPTILSQCSTVFAMRMANEADHAIIRSAVSDAGAAVLESLPSMGNREALAFGEAVSMPMRVRFSSLAAHELPNSKLANRDDRLADGQTADFLEDVVRRWRAVAQRER